MASQIQSFWERMKRVTDSPELCWKSSFVVLAFEAKDLVGVSVTSFPEENKNLPKWDLKMTNMIICSKVRKELKSSKTCVMNYIRRHSLSFSSFMLRPARLRQFEQQQFDSFLWFPDIAVMLDVIKVLMIIWILARQKLKSHFPWVGNEAGSVVL